MLVEPAPDQGQDLLDPRADDLGDLGARHLAGRHVRMIAQYRQLDPGAVVAAAELGAAEQILDPLGVGTAGREDVGEIAGDMVATIGHLIDQGQPPGGEVRQPGGAAAHVENQAAALQLILGQAGERARIVGADDALDLDMTALEAGQNVAQRRAGDA